MKIGNENIKDIAKRVYRYGAMAFAIVMFPVGFVYMITSYFAIGYFEEMNVAANLVNKIVGILLIVAILLGQLFAAYKAHFPLQKKAWITGLFFGTIAPIILLLFGLASPQAWRDPTPEGSSIQLEIFKIISIFFIVAGIPQILGGLTVAVKSKLQDIIPAYKIDPDFKE